MLLYFLKPTHEVAEVCLITITTLKLSSAKRKGKWKPNQEKTQATHQVSTPSYINLVQCLNKMTI
jgi:hypothetical protein